ncbi:MAG: cytochrome P450 [Streptosporangiales bacterium]|nr:cytochrome P450 [Streptosporangiales bacterium]
MSLSDCTIADHEFWGLPLETREQAFALLRAQPEPQFYQEVPFGTIPPGPGFYAFVKHADVVEASRRPDVWRSEPSAISIPDLPVEFNDFFGSLINMDDPRHARLRRIVSRGFTPRMLKQLEDNVQQSAVTIVDELLEKGPCDFVTEVAAKLPLKIICDMMGIPEKYHQSVFENSNIVLAGVDPDLLGDDFDEITVKLLTAGGELAGILSELADDRRKSPGDDLTSALVNANVDGESLTDQEVGSFFVLLAVAGNETTRNAISHALKLFTDFPEQRKLLLEDMEERLPGAVEEIVRYASPVIWMRRTAAEDVEMNGFSYKAGDKALLYYGSANRDETVFERPDEFDILRKPNPHVGFGGPGPHFCLGAHLARREITVMLRELLTRVPQITAGEPDRLYSSFINGIKRLPCDF